MKQTRIGWFVALAGLVLAAAVLVVPSPAEATPFHAISAGHACNTCHVEPVGWSNPIIWDRRCTMDCQGCHISPTGGGMRTVLGRYYGEEVLPMWGNRPGDGVDYSRYNTNGAPEEGRFRLFEGFEGWWPGEYQHRSLDDRYGDLNPSPTWQVGGDYRGMAVIPTDGDDARESAVFPMEFQVYLAAHPLSNLTAYLDIGIQGSQDVSVPGNDEDSRDFLTETLWLREMFVMLHDLPGATYVRAGRFALPYGWRIPDHSAYQRKGLFDQYRQALGVEAGFSPNEYWANLALWTQGAIEDWPGDAVAPGSGVTLQGGVRQLGYQIGGSLHAMNGTDGTANEIMLGPMWGVNLYPVAYLGELDYRHSWADDGGLAPASPLNAMYAYHEVRYLGTTGIQPRIRYEWVDENMDTVASHRHRIAAGALWNPYRYVQLDLMWRHEMALRRRDSNELLLQLHLWVL